MQSFDYYNPTRLVFGLGAIARLRDLVPAQARVLMVWGGGSILANGVHAQVRKALRGRDVVEFPGIEPNPRHATCLRAVATLRKTRRDFLLAVGGGSVFDAVKYIAAAACFKGRDPWAILSRQAPVTAALPWGGVLTLPATGSEANGNSVISNDATKDKLYFGSDLVRPIFSILDPATTCSLPERQTANGVVDAFVHVCEQYLTFPADAPLQDRQAEAILSTLVEEGPKALKKPKDLTVRANLMWCATQALNNLIGCGVPQDWATHMIGHELTALHGVDHAQSLAIVLPGVLTLRLKAKQAKLAQCAERVFGVRRGTTAQKAKAGIAAIEAFFRRMGLGTTLADHGIGAETCRLVPNRMAARGAVALGEKGDLGEREVGRILRLRLG